MIKTIEEFNLGQRYSYDIKLENAEIRNIVKLSKTFVDDKGISRTSEKIALTIEVGVDEDYQTIFLYDKNMDNLDHYKRGMVGVFTVNIKIDETYKGKTEIYIRSFKEA